MSKNVKVQKLVTFNKLGKLFDIENLSVEGFQVVEKFIHPEREDFNSHIKLKHESTGKLIDVFEGEARKTVSVMIEGRALGDNMLTDFSKNLNKTQKKVLFELVENLKAV